MLPACTDLQRMRAFEEFLKALPQVDIVPENLLHAGCFCRTIRVPVGVTLTGALMKVPTILIVSGHCVLTSDGKAEELKGSFVFDCAAGRKTAFLTLAETMITCVFATQATTVADAVREMTDDELARIE